MNPIRRFFKNPFAVFLAFWVFLFGAGTFLEAGQSQTSIPFNTTVLESPEQVFIDNLHTSYGSDKTKLFFVEAKEESESKRHLFFPITGCFPSVKKTSAGNTSDLWQVTADTDFNTANVPLYDLYCSLRIHLS